MINIIIKKDSDVITSLESKGHANSGISGKDIVCAAVSAVIIGGLNAIKEDDNYKCEVKEGYISLKAIKEQSAHDKIVIETIVIGLNKICEEYPKNIKITFK